jgi:hypothetical protein
MNKGWFLFLGIILTVFVSGCLGDVDKIYQISAGEDPQNQDSNVRFRTTYYFRVFDVCPTKAVKEDNNYETRMTTLLGRKSGEFKIMRDSLYRYRMTGKASAYFSNMRFESGVVRSDQIDPFSAAVSFDEESKLFKLSQNAEPDALPKRDTNNGICPDKNPAEQVFLLLGPEGVKILDKNERLMLAMYTDSKPLISMLRQVSGRKDEKPDDLSVFQALGEERAKLTQARSVVSNVKKELEIDEATTRLNPDSLIKELSLMWGMIPDNTNGGTSKQTKVQP